MELVDTQLDTLLMKLSKMSGCNKRHEPKLSFRDQEEEKYSVHYNVAGIVRCSFLYISFSSLLFMSIVSGSGKQSGLSHDTIVKIIII